MQQRNLDFICDALKLRQEGPCDGDFLRRLFIETYDGALCGLEPPLRDMLLSQQFAGQTASYRAAYPDARFEIIAHADAPIGRLVTQDGPDSLRIVDVAMLVKWRGRGAGAWTLRQVLDRANVAGAPVRLSVRPDNQKAERFYQQFGFATVERSETAIEMKRLIDHAYVGGAH